MCYLLGIGMRAIGVRDTGSKIPPLIGIMIWGETLILSDLSPSCFSHLPTDLELVWGLTGQSYGHWDGRMEDLVLSISVWGPPRSPSIISQERSGHCAGNKMLLGFPKATSRAYFQHLAVTLLPSALTNVGVVSELAEVEETPGEALSPILSSRVIWKEISSCWNKQNIAGDKNQISAL